MPISAGISTVSTRMVTKSQKRVTRPKALNGSEIPGDFLRLVRHGDAAIVKCIEELLTRQSERRTGLTAGEVSLKEEAEGQSEEKFRLVAFTMVGDGFGDFQDHGAI